jgi:hypothetical protein
VSFRKIKISGGFFCAFFAIRFFKPQVLYVRKVEKKSSFNGENFSKFLNNEERGKGE